MSQGEADGRAKNRRAVLGSARLDWAGLTAPNRRQAGGLGGLEQRSVPRVLGGEGGACPSSDGGVGLGGSL